MSETEIRALAEAVLAASLVDDRHWDRERGGCEMRCVFCEARVPMLLAPRGQNPAYEPLYNAWFAFITKAGPYPTFPHESDCIVLVALEAINGQ